MLASGGAAALSEYCVAGLLSIAAMACQGEVIGPAVFSVPAPPPITHAPLGQAPSQERGGAATPSVLLNRWAAKDRLPAHSVRL